MNNNPFSNSSLLLVGVCLLFVLLAGPGCESCCHKNSVKPWRTYIQSDSGHSLMMPDPANQLIIWRDPNSSDDDLSNWLGQITKKFGVIHITTFCQSCDSTLMLLTGPGVTQYIQTGPVKGGSGSGVAGGPSGGDGPVYYSVNFPVAIPEITDTGGLNLQLLNPVPPAAPFAKGPVTVAVFDTGLDSTRIGAYLYNGMGSPPPCTGSADAGGWNFTNNTTNWSDDYPQRHGTAVSWFIRNQVDKYRLNQLRILPVKIDDNQGKGSLFGVLCGFAYAKDRGAKIVNASFGFYSPRIEKSPEKVDSNVVLLKEYVRYYLTKNNILLIAAAGNTDNTNEPPVYPSTNPVDLRNLDSVSFYPASLSRELDNVIPVTTIQPTGMDTGQVSANQNFSPQVVYVGVNGDSPPANTTGLGGWTQAISSGDYPFLHSYLGGGQTLIGSSFATPIVTGKICAHYYLIENLLLHNRATRTNILDTLMKIGIANKNPAQNATKKISNGYHMIK